MKIFHLLDFRVTKMSTILHQLLDYIYKESRKRRKEQKENEFWVTDIIGCRIKAILSRKYPEVSALIGVSSRPMLGILAHKAIEYLVNVEKVINAESEKEAKLEVEVNGKKYYIVARPDILCNDADLVLDLKTALDIKGPVYSHYLQLWLYSLIFSKRKASIFYVTSLGGKWEEPVTWQKVITALIETKLVSNEEIATVFGIKDPNKLEEELSKQIPSDKIWETEEQREIWLSILKLYFSKWLQTEGPIWEWECNYCPYVNSFCLSPYKRVSQK